MNCPSCKLKLARIQYEGLNIRQCTDCRGHLVTAHRLRSIQSRRRNTEDDLLDEVAAEGIDTVEKLKCPACLRRMDKQKKKIGSLSFFIDHCGDCEHIWLDKGELAKLQVAFEYSEKGEEAERFRQRLANMSAADKAAFDQRVANLPEVNIPSEIAFEMLTEFRLGRWRFGR